MTERKKTGLLLAGKLAVLTITVWMTLSVVSYMFTWTADQSYLSSPAGTEVENAASTSGFSLGKLLVSDSFGLASLCIVAFMVLWSLSIVYPKSEINVKKAFFGLFSLTFLLSWVFAWAGMVFGGEYIFGGGLGGRCGTALVNLFAPVGVIVTGCILIAFVAIWLYCMSSRFSDWIMSRKPSPVEEPVVEPEPVPVYNMPEEPSEQEEPEEHEDPEEPVYVYGSANKEAEEDDPQEQEEGINIVKDEETFNQKVKELKPIDNRLDPPDGLPKYKMPQLSLLGDYIGSRHEVSQD